jgi:hypothetical protein
MEFRPWPIVTVGLTLLLVGCESMPFGRESNRTTQPAPLPAAPTAPVTQTTLPPPPATTLPPAGTDAAALDPAMQTAAATPAPPATPGVELTRPDLLGSWTIAAAGDSCQLSMALTTWTGGYRASTRGCSNAALTGISAWTLEGNQVQLFNDAGATVVRLYPASKTQFNGQTEGGGPVTVSR